MMILIFAMAALGQSPEQPARKDETVDRGREIVTQPAKDIGPVGPKLRFWPG